MAPPLLNPSDRYIHPETAKVYLIDSIADIATPLRGEVDAGVDITGEVAEMTGWETPANLVPTPDLGTKITGRIGGRVEPADSSIAFYGDRGTADIRDVVARGDKSHVMILHGGDVAGQKSDVYAVEVASVSKPINVAGDPARINVMFAISRVAEDVAIPA